MPISEPSMRQYATIRYVGCPDVGVNSSLEGISWETVIIWPVTRSLLKSVVMGIWSGPPMSILVPFLLSTTLPFNCVFATSLMVHLATRLSPPMNTVPSYSAKPFDKTWSGSLWPGKPGSQDQLKTWVVFSLLITWSNVAVQPNLSLECSSISCFFNVLCSKAIVYGRVRSSHVVELVVRP